MRSIQLPATTRPQLHAAPSCVLSHSIPRVTCKGSPYSTPLTTSHEEPQQAQQHQQASLQFAAPAPLAARVATPTTTQHAASSVQPPAIPLPSGSIALDYAMAEAAFTQLLHTPDLDLKVAPGSLLHDPRIHTLAHLLDTAVAGAMDTAYGSHHAARGLPLLPTAGASAGGVVAALVAERKMHKEEEKQNHPDVASNSTTDASAQQDEPQSPDEEMYAQAGSEVDAAHLFLQRLLYRINRLNLFWYDALSNYENERSLHLARLRDAIEASWTAWEAEQMGHDRINAIKQKSTSELKDELRALYSQDVEPPLSDVGRYITHEMGVEGYRQLLAIASLDGLVEASRQSRVCGGAANDIMCMIFKVLSEEYGTGRMSKKHSTFFAAMMKELRLCEQPEVYLHLVPWQVLAGANHNFLLTERRRHYLRYAGGLTFFEIVGPSVYRTYLAAAQRLNLSEQAAGYWALHIKEDERHGRWMLEDVAIPLVDKYPEEGWEVVLGYQQEKSMAGRAASVVLKRIREADEKGFTAEPRHITAGPTEAAIHAPQMLAAATPRAPAYVV